MDKRCGYALRCQNYLDRHNPPEIGRNYHSVYHRQLRRVSSGHTSEELNEIVSAGRRIIRAHILAMYISTYCTIPDQLACCEGRGGEGKKGNGLACYRAFNIH